MMLLKHIKISGSRYLVMLAGLFFMIAAGIPISAVAQNRVHTVYYEDTDHELHVYRIYGKQPGKTLLLIGGIQGDEPGGFLSADLYADLSLSRGNLIVVPRANFQSIVLHRRKINEDMNRKFSEDHNSNYETKIVTILKQLIQESDCLLNLHDGSGFFSEKWESPERNPKRFGQSIIADCESSINPRTGQPILLGDMARSVSEQINRHIAHPEYHFHFNNHRTGDVTSAHKEQRKSATYYALKTCGIPAFGIETSKSLPLETKVRHHNLAINAFMDRLGIETETPGFNLNAPKLTYLVIAVNDALPVAVTNGKALSIKPGDRLTISHIEANYERGLSADILGHGTMNDLRKTIRITKNTRIIVRKDSYPCGRIDLLTDQDRAKGFSRQRKVHPVKSASPMLLFDIRINGAPKIVHGGETVRVVKGDTFEIVDVISDRAGSDELKVNFKGFVGNPRNNTGEDRGYVIHTGKDLWERYAVGNSGNTYQVIVSHLTRTIGTLFIDLEDPTLNYVLLQVAGQPVWCLFRDYTAPIDPKQTITLLDVATNSRDNDGVNLFFVDPGVIREQIPLKTPFRLQDMLDRRGVRPSTGSRFDIQREDRLLGSVHVDWVRNVPSAQGKQETAD